MQALWVRGGCVALVAGIGMSLLYLAYHQAHSRPASVTVVVPSRGQADAGIKRFTYQQSREGRIRWEVEAERAQMYDSRHQALLENVQVSLFGRQDREMIVHAKRGMIDTATNSFELVDQEDFISVTFTNGLTLLTPILRWRDETQEFYSPAPVIIHRQGLTITGIGLVGNLETEQFQVLNYVTVDIAS
ncbi:MAG: LPS export ABC transporter periplasmic protein LptC [Nitrospirae bacterium]|nr:MAG: LPS export ABC transporter periplasmic protein LptC [Nitrospirota bacterium]